MSNFVFSSTNEFGKKRWIVFLIYFYLIRISTRFSQAWRAFTQVSHLCNSRNITYVFLSRINSLFTRFEQSCVIDSSRIHLEFGNLNQVLLNYFIFYRISGSFSRSLSWGKYCNSKGSLSFSSSSNSSFPANGSSKRGKISTSSLKSHSWYSVSKQQFFSAPTILRIS